MQNEWDNYQKLFQPGIVSRIGLVVFTDSPDKELFGTISHEEEEAVVEIRNKLNSELKNGRHSKPDAFFMRCHIFANKLVQEERTDTIKTVRGVFGIFLSNCCGIIKEN